MVFPEMHNGNDGSANPFDEALRKLIEIIEDATIQTLELIKELNAAIQISKAINAWQSPAKFLCFIISLQMDTPLAAYLMRTRWSTAAKGV